VHFPRVITTSTKGSVKAVQTPEAHEGDIPNWLYGHSNITEEFTHFSILHMFPIQTSEGLPKALQGRIQTGLKIFPLCMGYTFATFYLNHKEKGAKVLQVL
jgi:hypothetical protein